ncbi:MAG TPA: capsular polysaccharide synthesis protein [Candidatus Paceibacterota bacterium]|jgi:hypothetical protein|nr:capsular polysaccharide synthesis protein [Candidatus Paceibacterota bacterium]
MKTARTAKDVLWWYGFRLFVEFKHPTSAPTRLLRAVRRRLSKHGPEAARPLSGAPKPVPKKIWIYWAQGFEQAPALVRMCQDSWVRQNSDWEVVLLTDQNLNAYIALPSLAAKDIPHAAYSDIVRVELLTKYGGVWADATTLCTAPLDSWLPGVMQSGFFAFEKPKTTLASWFLAAQQGNNLMAQWAAYTHHYWSLAQKPGRYFWFHYLFEYLVTLNKDARRAWQGTPRVSSQGPYALQRALKSGSDIAECERILNDQTIRVHKLDWRLDFPEEFVDKLRD